MMVSRRTGGLRAALTAVAALGAVAIGCIDRPVAKVETRTQSGVSEEVRNEAIDKVDLLLEVDNSGSMRENQANIMQQFGLMINTLTNPPCRSRSNPAAPPHTCDPNNMDDVRAYPAVKDLHVGVISSDLGTPGSSVPGCANSDLGDDGLLNPIRYGQALADHLPWMPRRGDPAPPGFRPADCTNRDQFPSFITFTSGVTDPAMFEHDFKCNAGLYVNGCGLEQQLEAVWRALVWHDPRERAGNNDPNRGFIRDDALLAIVLLTDEEDGSVRDCRFARGDQCQAPGTIDVFNSASTRWSSTNLNLRFYLYRPCSDQDPTWPLDRYVDPSNLTRGYMGLKPGHPERIVFAAITGVPLQIPMRGTGTNATVDWDQLLGAPDPNNADNFCARNYMTAVDMMSAEGPISMRAANQDPNCSDRTVPACRREGSTYDPMRPPCTTTEQYYAWPARRVVEIARRFDQSPMCNGGPCHNGLVTSICSNNYSSAMRQIIEKIQSRLTGRCLPRRLDLTTRADGLQEASCIVREILPAGQTECDASRGRRPPADESARTTTISGETRTVCDVDQVPTDPNNGNQPMAGGIGWFYDRTPDPNDQSCTQRISFTSTATPVSGSVTRLECIQQVRGAM
jgi:hypothetical protein